MKLFCRAVAFLRNNVVFVSEISSLSLHVQVLNKLLPKFLKFLIYLRFKQRRARVDRSPLFRTYVSQRSKKLMKSRRGVYHYWESFQKETFFVDVSSRETLSFASISEPNFVESCICQNFGSRFCSHLIGLLPKAESVRKSGFLRWRSRFTALLEAIRVRI